MSDYTRNPEIRKISINLLFARYLIWILHAFQNSVENTAQQKVRALACRVRQPRTGKSPGPPRHAGKSSSDLPHNPFGADFSNEKSGFNQQTPFPSTQDNVDEWSHGQVYNPLGKDPPAPEQRPPGGPFPEHGPGSTG